MPFWKACSAASRASCVETDSTGATARTAWSGTTGDASGSRNIAAEMSASTSMEKIRGGLGALGKAANVHCDSSR